MDSKIIRVGTFSIIKLDIEGYKLKSSLTYYILRENGIQYGYLPDLDLKADHFGLFEVDKSLKNQIVELYEKFVLIDDNKLNEMDKLKKELLISLVEKD
ncbi:MAG: hypothetical protein KDK36_03740 [Leptospiraceae bacterium]|nr:hypothetical protein [Leptospiraceae bacterium]